MIRRIRRYTTPVLCFLLFLTIIAGFSTVAAQEYPEEPPSQGSADTARRFDVAAATDYARKHWNDGNGFCADFCYAVLKAGGFVINGSANRSRAYTQYNHLVNELGFKSYYLGAGKVTQNADKIEEGDLVLWDKSYKLKGVTSDTVSIVGSGGHIVYISVANGPNSKFCAHNSAKRDAVLNTGASYGLWLVKTSDMAGNEKIVVKDVPVADYEILVSGNIHMTPNGALLYGADGAPAVTSRRQIVSIDKTCVAGGYTWGRIVNAGWDWIVIGQGRTRDTAISTEIGTSGRD